MVVILLITVMVIIFKVVFIDQDPDPNISTFRPLDQMIGSNIRYNGNTLNKIKRSCEFFNKKAFSHNELYDVYPLS